MFSSEVEIVPVVEAKLDQMPHLDNNQTRQFLLVSKLCPVQTVHMQIQVGELIRTCFNGQSMQVTER